MLIHPSNGIIFSHAVEIILAKAEIEASHDCNQKEPYCVKVEHLMIALTKFVVNECVIRSKDV